MDYFFSDFYGFTVSPKLRYVVTVFGSIELTKITTFINSDVFFDSIIETVTNGASEKIHKTCLLFRYCNAPICYLPLLLLCSQILPHIHIHGHIQIHGHLRIHARPQIRTLTLALRTFNDF